MGSHAVTGRIEMAWKSRPFTLVLTLTLAPVGLLAVILGDSVSAALSHIAAGVVSRVMGALLLGGGVTTLVGVARHGMTLEALGLSLMAAGLGIYGAGVIIGLGLAGMVAGPIALALAVASAQRVHVLLITARTFREDAVE